MSAPIATSGASAIIIPPVVATALPPFSNFKKTGRACPTIAANPASTAATSSTSSDAINTGTNPFATSTRIVGTPSFHPIARQTFVAPIECEPTRRMSIPRKIRTSQ